MKADAGGRELFSGIQFGMDDWGERARLACGFGRRPRTMGGTIHFGRKVFGATPETAHKISNLYNALE